MSGSSLKKKIVDGLARLLNERVCLAPFVEKEASFEGWLQVELCGILNKKGSKIIPEFKIEGGRGIDIVVKEGDEPKYAIELTVIPRKQIGDLKRICNNINKLENLRKDKSMQGVVFFIIFIVFPVNANNANIDDCGISGQSHTVLWKTLCEIKNRVYSLERKEFTFCNKTGGVIYLGILKTAVKV